MERQGRNSVRRETWPVRFFVPALGLLVTCLAIVIAADVPLRLGLLIYPEQVVAAILGLSIAICFLLLPVSRHWGQSHVPWYDLLLSAAGLFVGGYFALRYPVLSQEFFSRPTETLIVGCLTIPLVLEGLRRATGNSLFVVVAVFVLYAQVADQVPGRLQGMTRPLDQLLPFLAIDTTAMFGTPLMIVGTIVIVFIFFGQLLIRTGGSEWFTDLSTSAVGRTRGGSAKIAIVASGLFGSISGSAVANVASTGVITIPMMKRAGFSARTAGAFEAVASTGGQIMPPVMGAAAFLMAEFLQIPYAHVVIAAAVPAILYYLAVLVQADFEAARQNIPPVPNEQIKPFAAVMRAGWYFPAPFAMLITALFYWNAAPAEAALWASATIVVMNVVFGFRGHRMLWRDFLRALAATGQRSVDIVLVGAAAGIVIGIFENTGLGFGLTYLLVDFGRTSLLLLLVLTAIICVILGMGMPTTGIYLLVATLAAPPLIQLGVEPIAAHLFILYFGLMSMISPPVAIAAFTAASIAQAGAMATAFTAVRLGWTAFIIPFLFVYSPHLLLQGDALHIAVAVVTALVGVVFVSGALIGYLQNRLRPLPRLLLGLSGLMLIVPPLAIPYGAAVNVVGAVVAAMLMATYYLGNQSRGARTKGMVMGED